jgi:hypothetical protein
MPVPVIAERNAGQDRLNLRTPEPFSVGNAGAIGDGLADDYNALFEAARKQGTSGAIFLPPGTYAVGTSLTIACQVIFAFGAKLKPDTGVTVTLAGPVTTAPGDGIIAIGTGGTVNVTGPLNASGVSVNRGNNSATLTAAGSLPIQRWEAPLTTDRTVTLPLIGVVNGAAFRIIRAASSTGAFSLNVGAGPLKALDAGQWCEVTYDGSAWILTAFGSL